jgi:hypothetical protein
MKGYIDIIKEVGGKYNTTNRAEDDDTCVYYKDGNMCAVAMNFENPIINVEFINADGELNYFENGDIVLLYQILDCDIDRMKTFFKEDVRHLVTDESIYGFWSDLQDLHDTCSNWDESGLSESGRVNYENMLSMYAEENEFVNEYVEEEIEDKVLEFA